MALFVLFSALTDEAGEGGALGAVPRLPLAFMLLLSMLLLSIIAPLVNNEIVEGCRRAASTFGKMGQAPGCSCCT